MKTVWYLAIIILGSSALHAQDSRNVAEPVVPPVCVSLDALLSSTPNGIAEADERQLDSVRIPTSCGDVDKSNTGHIHSA